MATIDSYLLEMVKRKASDLHLVAGRPPLLRLHGELEPLTPSPFPADKLRAMLEEIAGPGLSATYRRSGDADFAYALPGVARFRVNLFVQQNGPAAVLRIIPEKVLTLDDLGAPAPICSRAWCW